MMSINPKYPVLGIGGVIFDDYDYVARENSKIKQFKTRVFGNDSIVLHSREIRKKTGAFTCLQDPALEASFKAEYDALIGDLQFVFISRIINKAAHRSKYVTPFPPYEWAVELVIESFARFLYRNRARGRVLCEARGAASDRRVKDTYTRLLAAGTNYISSSQFRNSITALSFVRKAQNVCGLQIADMSIYTATSATLYRNFKRRDYLVLKNKFDPYHGLKVFPDISLWPQFP